jgi:hypothetical protein
MVRKLLLALVTVLMVGMVLAAFAAQPKASAVQEGAMELASARAGSMHLGPYATIRRAWEVANYYRGLGCRTSVPYHNGDGYYVDVTCDD